MPRIQQVIDLTAYLRVDLRRRGCFTRRQHDIGDQQRDTVEQDHLGIASDQHSADVHGMFYRLPLGRPCCAVLCDALAHFVVARLRGGDVRDAPAELSGEFLCVQCLAAARAAQNENQFAVQAISSLAFMSVLVSPAPATAHARRWRCA